MMNIEELRAARHQLEKELREVIDKKVNDFRIATGASVESIDVKMCSVSIIGCEETFLLNSVKVRLVL